MDKCHQRWRYSRSVSHFCKILYFDLNLNNPSYDFFILSGRQRRPWYEKVDRPRNQTVDKWIEDRIRFQIKVIQHLARNDGVINPHQLVRETGFTIGWVKRRLKQCDYRYYLHKKRLISKKLILKI